jgi:hypothetical protein
LKIVEMNQDLEQARGLFENSERETEPSRKFANFEEAFELLETCLSDPAATQSDKTIVDNLRSTNLRRLVRQLNLLRTIKPIDWAKFIGLLMTFDAEIKLILDEDPTLAVGYDRFIRFWAPEFLEALERLEKKGG